MVHLMAASLLVLFLLQADWPHRTGNADQGRMRAIARSLIVHHEAAILAVAASPGTKGTVTPSIVAPASPWRATSCASGGVVASWISSTVRAGVGRGEPLVAHVRDLLGRTRLHNPGATPAVRAGLADPPGLGVVRNGAFVSTVGAGWVLPAACTITEGSVVLITRAA